MARRRKHRTHVQQPDGALENDGTPRSFIIKHGQVGPMLAQLVRDMRKVMEPNTASRLKVRIRLVGMVCRSSSKLASKGENPEQTEGLPDHGTCDARFASARFYSYACRSVSADRPFAGGSHIDF